MLFYKKKLLDKLIQVGVHYGHQIKNRHPNMIPFIFNKYQNIHIINIHKTLSNLIKVTLKLQDLILNNKKILFVGTKPLIKNLVKSIACDFNQYYINHRWLGGLLTNWETIKNSIYKLIELENQYNNKLFEVATKQEAILKMKKMKKLQQILDGIKYMKVIPDALFIIDPQYENIAVQEAKKLKIKIFAIVDTNCNPNDIDYIIPGNDDSYRAINFYFNFMKKIILLNITNNDKI